MFLVETKRMEEEKARESKKTAEGIADLLCRDEAELHEGNHGGGNHGEMIGSVKILQRLRPHTRLPDMHRNGSLERQKGLE